MTGASRLCLAVSVLFGVGAVASYRRTSQKMASWQRTSGTVVEIKSEERRDTDDDLQLMHASMIRFSVHGRDAVTFQDPVWATRACHTVGQHVPVLYDPADLTSATLAGWRSYGATIGFGVGAMVFLLISVAES